MTRREVLSNIVCAYIQGCGSFPKLDSEGNFNPAWYATVEAICKKYPEEDKQEVRLMSATDCESWLNLKACDTSVGCSASVGKTSTCEDRCCCSDTRHYDY